MDELLDKIKRLGMPQGSPTLGGAFDILKRKRIDNRQKNIADDYEIDRVRTKSRGGTDSWGTLQDWFELAQAGRMNDIHSTPTQQELDYGTQELPVQQGAVQPMPPVQPQEAILGATNSDFGQFASDWYSSKGHSGQADKAALIASKAVELGLDPYIALALSAQEGGWARYDPEDSPHNYFGWGVTDSGDMGLAGESLEHWLDTYIPDIARQYGQRERLADWGGSLDGYGKGSPYTARYNYNDSWIDALSSLVNDANSFRATNHPNLPGPGIDVNFRY